MSSTGDEVRIMEGSSIDDRPNFNSRAKEMQFCSIEGEVESHNCNPMGCYSSQ